MNGQGKKIAVTLALTQAELDSVVTFLEEVRYRYGNAAQLFGMVYDGHASGHFSTGDLGPVAMCETARDAFTHYSEGEGEMIELFVQNLRNARDAARKEGIKDALNN